MATENRLNQVVKGAPPPELHVPPVQPLPHLTGAAQTDKYSPDPLLSTLPSAPPQIYLNLLILESSLRAQYLHLLSRRRLNTFFLLLLGLWNCFFFYALFLRPREDGTGLGGSVYWVIETSEKLALIGGTVTVLLVWATGQWERGVRWPRRWLGLTNRGLRGFNLRVVVVKRKWWREVFEKMAYIIPFGLLLEAGGSDWHMVEHENGGVIEEDLARGGDHVMLLLLPKSFSPEFRENWEEYRSDYWEKENQRRRQLRKKMKLTRRVQAKEQGGWKWWTGAWRLLIFYPHRRQHDLEKHPQHSHGVYGASGVLPAATKTGRRRSSRMRTGSNASRDHSRQSSRSSTPHIEFDGFTENPVTERVRRGSSVSSTASVRRKVRERRDGGGGTGLAGGGLGLSPLTSAIAIDEDHHNTETKPKERPRRATKTKEKEKEKDKKEDKDVEKEHQPGTPGSEFDGMIIPAPRAGIA